MRALIQTGLLSLALILAASTTSAHAQIGFADLTGEWTANGQTAARPDGPLERSRCRVSVQAGNSGGNLTIDGRCAIAAGTAYVTMQVFDDGNGQMRGEVTTSTFQGPAQLTGTRSGNSISLATQAAMLFEDRHYWSRVEITLTDETRFELKEWTAVQASADWHLTRDMVFEQQGAE